MIVVSDTSPLNYLVLLGAVDVLPELFGQVHSPPAVIRELLHDGASDVVRQWAMSPPDWIRISAPSELPPAAAGLDPGEAEAIALAIELGAKAVLIDEKKGRRVAQSQGLAALGTITVLQLAAEVGLLDLKAALDSLRLTSFYITQPMIDATLERHAMRKRT